VPRTGQGQLITVTENGSYMVCLETSRFSAGSTLRTPHALGVHLELVAGTGENRVAASGGDPRPGVAEREPSHQIEAERSGSPLQVFPRKARERLTSATA
jgi:hypothetical protein